MTPPDRLMVQCPQCGEIKFTGLFHNERRTKAFGHSLCHNGHNWEWSLGETFVEMIEEPV